MINLLFDLFILVKTAISLKLIVTFKATSNHSKFVTPVKTGVQDSR